MTRVDYDLQKLMPDTITVELPLGTDAYSRPIYGTATSYRARVEQSTALVRDQDGRERISNTQIYFYCTVRVPFGARIMFDDGTTYPIMGIDSVSDENGAYFTKVSM